MDVAAQPGTWVDPYRAYHFKLVLNGVDNGHFTEVSGLGVRVERIAYREAGANSVVRAIPGRVTYSPVVLRYGLTSSGELWDWLMTAVTGRVNRRNVSIAVLDPTGADEVLRWNLLNAWPQEWLGAPLDAMTQELAVETLVLAHEGLEREVSGGASVPSA
ncbi:phage tail protein [Cryptosporangium phraense]|uniref:Phage tail protein n=1 Tax=Cryptosporangium phraense TaxID=2593070 RepID=A0A545AQ42_9ACTN|nr:phage tail protein [Cryptosporangium phraense]TQS43381.1 phage tail protein [Cryptosporangium phraense]